MSPTLGRRTNPESATHPAIGLPMRIVGGVATAWQRSRPDRPAVVDVGPKLSPVEEKPAAVLVERDTPGRDERVDAARRAGEELGGSDGVEEPVRLDRLALTDD